MSTTPALFFRWNPGPTGVSSGFCHSYRQSCNISLLGSLMAEKGLEKQVEKLGFLIPPVVR